MPRPLQGLTPEDCPFCEVAGGRLAPETVAFRNDTALAFPSLHQREANRGHHLVVPNEHVADIYKLPEQLHAAMFGAVAHLATAVREAFNADGITIMQHNEFAGGQDVFHLHVHVVPRFKGDGFYHGDERWPRGLHEVSQTERQSQAETVREVMGRRARPPAG